MNRGMLAIAVMLFLCWTAPVLAETPAGAATYRVTIVLYPGDDPAAVAKRLAAMYRGTLETPVDGNGSFTISLSEAAAGLMGRDPAVAEMDAPSLASHVATGVSATAALPASERPVETHATTGWTLGPYQYDGSGNIRKVGSDFYVYDKLGRIVVSADAQPSVVHKQAYTYDRYGNLRTINTAGRAAATLDISGVSNRLASVSNGSASAPVGYDASGNFTSYLGATYEYDALNVMRRSVTGGVTRSYVYTANDERIGTIEQTGAAIRSDWTLRDSAGQVLRRYSKESNGEWKWQEDYIYRGTHMLAAEIPDHPKTRHFHLDHLGTPPPDHRQRRRRNLPPHLPPLWRGDRPQPDAREKKQFTGHERDSESLDYMHARFYAPFDDAYAIVVEDPRDDLPDLLLPVEPRQQADFETQCLLDEGTQQLRELVLPEFRRISGRFAPLNVGGSETVLAPDMFLFEMVKFVNLRDGWWNDVTERHLDHLRWRIATLRTIRSTVSAECSESLDGLVSDLAQLERQASSVTR